MDFLGRLLGNKSDDKRPEVDASEGDDPEGRTPQEENVGNGGTDEKPKITDPATATNQITTGGKKNKKLTSKKQSKKRIKKIIKKKSANKSAKKLKKKSSKK